MRKARPRDRAFLRVRANVRPLSECALRVEHSHELMRARVDDDDFVANEKVVISTPARIHLHEFHRHPIEVDRAGHSGANRDRKFTFVVDFTFCYLMTVRIVVRCSVDRLAAAP
jgi:hypothetical protein